MKQTDPSCKIYSGIIKTLSPGKSSETYIFSFFFFQRQYPKTFTVYMIIGSTFKKIMKKLKEK